ncbi:hypothetical protein [Yersinia sp. Marseille-Q3913]|nr:hypothetical protein [Yersinia sp. Marseille-Q3913]
MAYLMPKAVNIHPINISDKDINQIGTKNKLSILHINHFVEM